MGELRLNDISYSGNQGALLLNGIDYTGGGGGGGGGTSLTKIVDHEKVSSASPGRYETITFDDISSYKYVLIKTYSIKNSVEYSSLTILRPNVEISNNIWSFSNQLYAPISGTITSLTGLIEYRITNASLTSNNHRGDWLDIFADIYVTNDEIFS